MYSPMPVRRLMVRWEVAVAAAANIAAPLLACMSAVADANQDLACNVLHQLLCWTVVRCAGGCVVCNMV